MRREGHGFKLGAAAVLAVVLACAVPAAANAATISVGDTSALEGGLGPSNAVFDVSLSEAATEEVTVDFATSDGTALALLGDYLPHSETVTFAPGETSKQVAVQLNDDLVDEPDETFAGDLSNASANASIADPQGTATIVDDDGAPGISIDDVTGVEGDSGQNALAFTISLSNASALPVTVDYVTSNGTATTSDGDYAAAAGTVTFAPGETSKSVVVNVSGDTKDESDETFEVNLAGNSANSSLSDAQGVGTIQNDDADPAISIGDVSATEGGNSGLKDFDFTVSLSNPSDQQITVDYATADGTSTTADGDYEPANGTITFAPGETSKTATVKVNGDARDESDETFTVGLSNASPASSVADGTGTGTIQNDDPNPAISIEDLSDAEGNSGQKSFDFAVSLSNPSDQQVSVDYATADGSATTADGDYESASGTLIFDPRQTSKTVTVPVNGDDRDEADETFHLGLANNSANSSIADGGGVGTIRNDDGDPVVSIDDVTSTEGDGGQRDYRFTLSLSNPSDQPLSVGYTTSDGSATAGDGDYVPDSGTVTFAPGDVSKVLAIAVNGDTADEPHETFGIDLSDSSPPSSIGDDRGIGMIHNDDGPPTAGACPPATSNAQEGSVGALGNFRLAQTFTSQITAVAESLHVKVDKRPGAGGDWVFSLNSTDESGAPTDDALGAITIPDSAVASGISTVGGTLDEPVALTAGERYALVLTRPGATEVRTRIRAGEACGGEIFRSTDQSGAFAAIASFPGIPPGLDIVFAVCGSAGSCFPPAEAPPGAEPPPPAPEVQLPPGLSVSLATGKKKVRSGQRVLLSGRIDSGGSEACSAQQTVSLQRRRPGGAGFKTFAQVQTDAQGSFSLKQKVKKTSEYRAQVSGTSTCAGGASNTETVKVRSSR